MRTVLTSGFLLALFAVVGTGLVAFTFEGTKERIADNERNALLANINQLLPRERYDNAIYEDRVYVIDRAQLGTPEPVTIYRARKQGQPVAAVLMPTAPDGYSGPIRLIVGINYDGTLAGVRVLAHKETPGLGDAIDVERSDWVHGFEERSLGNPEEGRWKVKKDGGVFDQFTGATITPRAVVKAVYHSLKYFESHRDELFSAPAQQEPGKDAGHGGR